MVFKPKQSKNPYGYRNLLAYKKADELQMEAARVCALFPKSKTLLALADQINRSARSSKQNIAEGWKRNSTKEYYDFLGFAVASNAELEEDCNDVWNGIYPELMGIKGIMGEKGNEKKGERENGTMEGKGIAGGRKEGVMGIRDDEEKRVVGERRDGSRFTHLSPYPHLDIEKLRFYPLDASLPPIVQIKLRAKELNFILSRLQKSLELKIAKENEDLKKRIVNNFRQQW